jgi:hypothetical protein
VMPKKIKAWRILTARGIRTISQEVVCKPNVLLQSWPSGKDPLSRAFQPFVASNLKVAFGSKNPFAGRRRTSAICAFRPAGVDGFCSLMGQGGSSSGVDAFGCLRSLRARSALDGVSWVQGGSVEIAVGQRLAPATQSTPSSAPSLGRVSSDLPCMKLPYFQILVKLRR